MEFVKTLTTMVMDCQCWKRRMIIPPKHSQVPLSWNRRLCVATDVDEDGYADVPVNNDIGRVWIVMIQMPQYSQVL